MSPEQLPESWREALAGEFSKPYFGALREFLERERAEHQVFPPEPDVFNAFHLAPFDQVKVLLLGQDPYHDDGQAHGLCFSVRPGVRKPPSLANMLKELHADLGCKVPNNGHLVPWAEQGILMLNAVLTVRAHQANSHKGMGLGDVHRRGHPGPRRPPRAGRLCALGRVCAEEGEADRPRPESDHRLRPPVAPLGHEVLRLAAVLEGQRGIGDDGPGPDRLAVAGPLSGPDAHRGGSPRAPNSGLASSDLRSGSPRIFRGGSRSRWPGGGARWPSGRARDRAWPRRGGPGRRRR